MNKTVVAFVSVGVRDLRVFLLRLRGDRLVLQGELPIEDGRACSAVLAGLQDAGSCK